MSNLHPRLTCGVLLGALVAGCGARRAVHESGEAGSGGGGRNPMLCADGPSASQFAVRTAEVTVHLTKNGKVWTPEPTLQLRGTNARVESLYDQPIWSAAGDGQGTYSVTVPYGTYDVLMNGGGGLAGSISRGVAVNGPTVVTSNYQTVTVSGLVLLRGGVFPFEEGGPGSICARSTTPDDSINVCSELNRAGSFVLTLPRARLLELTWSRGGRMANTAPPGQVPFGSQVLLTSSFDGDEVLQLDINAPSLILSGRVSVDGGSRHLPVELTVGPVTLMIADDAASSFAVRLLAGTYSALLIAPGGIPGHTGFWQACPAAGCSFTADAEMIVDVSSAPPAPPPTGVVEGTLDFAPPPGSSLALTPGQSAGQVILRSVLGTLGTPHYPFVAQISVDGNLRFRLQDVPYGTYAVRFEGSTGSSAPGGFIELGMLVVDRAQVAWTETVPLVPVVLDLTVNGKVMSDDSLRDGEQRGDLVFSDPAGQMAGWRYVVDLGESGAARFERLMIPGRYSAIVRTWKYLGRTHREGYAQDVLPTGELNLGVVEIADHAPETGFLTLPLDLAVRRARIQITDGARVTGGPPKHTMVRLTDDAGSYSWGEVPTDGGPVELDLYRGCYDVEVFGSELAAYPSSLDFQGLTRLGIHCTCE
ncbi:MAG: hypothetical protein ABI560_10730 [Myxococcales bacterium]